LLDTAASNRCDDPELGKVSADRVDGGSLLADQQMARAMKHQAALLLDRLDRNKPHARSRDRFADRLCIDRVILLSLDIGLRIGRRYQPHGVAERLKLAPPIVRGGASFDANQARRKLREKRQNQPTLQLTTDHHLPSRINSMHLENRLRDVETNRCNRLHG
jgi:hypothetical protein